MASHPAIDGQLGFRLSKKDLEPFWGYCFTNQQSNLIYLQWKLKGLLQHLSLVGFL